MLSTSAQQKVFSRLLSNPSNARCADCNAKSPTWASIDFGVFVCLNCSGAHRALGPSVTRVRSTKLDTWQSEWVQLMELGNQLCNSYWLANLGTSAKITANSGLDEIKRYVVDKYVKRKYAKNNDSDPVTNLKNFKANKNRGSADFSNFDFKNLKDEDRFKTVSGGGGFSFQAFSTMRKNSGSEEKIKKKESFDIFNFEETPKHHNNFIKESVPSTNLYHQHGSEAIHKNHGHSLDYYTISHGGNFPITFNQVHQHKQNTHMPTFNELTSLFPTPHSSQQHHQSQTQTHQQPQTQIHYHAQPQHQQPQPQPQQTAPSSFNFGNVFSQPHNSNTKAPVSHSFDIFGQAQSSSTASTSFNSFQQSFNQPQSQPQQQQQPQKQPTQQLPAVNMNINMYANSINFNYVPQPEHKHEVKKDPFGDIDEFNF